MAKLPLTSDELLTTTRSVRKRLDLERGSAGAGRKLSQFRQYAKVAGVDPGVAPEQVEQQAQRRLAGAERLDGVSHGRAFVLCQRDDTPRSGNLERFQVRRAR